MRQMCSGRLPREEIQNENSERKPGGNDVIRLGDRVIVVAKDGNIQDLRDILK